MARRALYDEGIAALLHGAVAGRGFFPAAIEAELAAAYTTTAIRNTALLHELEAALAALGRANVPGLLLKGAALAETVYGDPALRPMADCDLLVRPADLAAAQAALESLEPSLIAGHTLTNDDVRLPCCSRSRCALRIVARRRRLNPRRRVNVCRRLRAATKRNVHGHGSPHCWYCPNAFALETLLRVRVSSSSATEQSCVPLSLFRIPRVVRAPHHACALFVQRADDAK